MAETRTPSAMARVIEKRGGRHGAHARAKTFFDQSVGGEKISAKIPGEEQQDDQHAPDQIAENKLKESQIAAVRDGRSADDGQSGGFRGDDGERQRPPRRGAAAQKIFAGGGVAIARRGADGEFALPATKMHAQRSYGQEVDDDDGEIERMDVHRGAVRIVAR